VSEFIIERDLATKEFNQDGDAAVHVALRDGRYQALNALLSVNQSLGVAFNARGKEGVLNRG